MSDFYPGQARPHAVRWALSGSGARWSSRLIAMLIFLGTPIAATAGDPTVTKVTPNFGPMSGDSNTVVLTGSGFSNLNAAAICDSQGYCSVIYNRNNTGDTTIALGVPSMAHPGHAQIFLASNGTQFGPWDYLLLSTPSVSQVSPSSGSLSGGTAVSLTGLSFTNATAVKFGAANAQSFTVNSDTQITATAPTGAAGAADITVVTSYGVSGLSAADRFTYMPPTVNSLSSPGGPATGGKVITLAGANFTGATAVKFGSVSAPSFTVNSDIKITVTTPVVPGGQMDITVVTPSGVSATSAADQFDAYTYPNILGVSPNAGPRKGGTVVITGSHFTGATGVKIGGSAATSWAVNSDTQITATFPSSWVAITSDVTVLNSYGSSAATAADKYTYQ